MKRAASVYKRFAAFLVLAVCFTVCFSAAVYGAETIVVGQQDHSSDIMSEEEMAELPHLLTPYQSYNCVWYSDNDVDRFSMAGTEYYQGFKRQAYGGGPEAFFDLRRAFREVTFLIGHIDGARTGNGTLHIYMDDTPVQDIPLTADMNVQTVSLAVTDVTQLRLWIEGADAGYGIANITAFGGHLYNKSISDLLPGQDEIEYLYTCDCCGYEYRASEVPDPAEENYLSPYQTINVTSMEKTEDELDCFYVTGIPRYKGLDIENYSSEREAIYNLSKEYTTVTFTVGHVDNARTGEAVLTIYGDGELLQQEELTYSMLEKRITLDTSGLTQLKIHYSGADSAYGIYGMTYEKANAESDDEIIELPAADENVYLEPYQSSNMRSLDNAPDSTDCFYTMGVARRQGCIFNNYSSEREVIYNLNSDYDTVAFQIGHVDMERRGDATLRIFGNGELLAEFPLHYDMIDQPFLLDAKGMLQLKISYSGSDSAYGIYDVIGGQAGADPVSEAVQAAPGAVTAVSEAVTAAPGAVQAVSEAVTAENGNNSSTEGTETEFLTPYQTSNLYCLPDENDPDRSFYIMGVEHKQGCSFTNYNSDREAIYNLNGAYLQVSFSVGHIDKERNGSAKLRIYGDGVLMKEDDLVYDMIDRSYTINTKGLMQIKISYTGSDSAYGIYDVCGVK